MAETVHGTKPAQFGPKHAHDNPSLLCQDGQCETCAARIFVLHLVFFRDEFKTKPNQWSLVCCPGEKCEKQTGRIRTGMLAAEIFQVHKHRKCATLFGPIKKCGCAIHVKSWLICSPECQAKSKFAESTPEKDRIAVRKEYEKGVFSISELGPYLVVGQYLSPDAAAEPIDPATREAAAAAGVTTASLEHAD